MISDAVPVASNPPITLPMPPYDINVVQPQGPHSPPRVEDVLDAISYRQAIDASIGM